MVRVFALSCCLLVASTGASAEAPRFDRVAHLIERGHVRARAGDMLSAMAYFRDAVSAGPRDVRGYQALGDAYLELKEAQRAIEVFDAGIVTCGERPELLLSLARAHDEAGATDLALLIVRRLCLRKPELIEAQRLRARVAEEAGLFYEALDARRAVVAALEADGHSVPRDARLQVRALEIILGDADRVHGPDACTGQTSALRRALSRCPP